MNVALVQFDIAWEDKPANHATIERMLIEAGVEPGAYVLLPELGDTGFSFNVDGIADDQTLIWATSLASRLGIWLQPGFAERSDDGKGRNCAAIISPTGDVLGIYRKVHPFSYGKEAEHYTGGGELLIRSCGGAAVCPMICYDLRFPELWRIAATTCGSRSCGGSPLRPGPSCIPRPPIGRTPDNHIGGPCSSLARLKTRRTLWASTALGRTLICTTSADRSSSRRKVMWLLKPAVSRSC